MTDRRIPHATRRPLSALALTGLIAALGAGAVLAADHAVSISGFSYSPRTVTIAVGDTVTWTNSDAQAHTATADDDAWDSGAITNGSSRTVTFNSAGTFAYHCSIHAEMTGTVVVQGAAATQPTTDTVASADAAGGTGPGWAALVAVGLAGLGGLLAAWRRFGVRRR